MRTLRFVTSRLALLLVPILFGLGCQSQSTSGNPNGGGLEIKEVASADALLADVDKTDADVRIVNMWATWCAPCVVEFPILVETGREYADRNVALRFLSIDDPEMEPRVRTFLDEHGVMETSYLWTGERDFLSEAAPQAVGVIPVTLLYDGEGELRYVNRGIMTHERLSEQVDALLDGSAPEETLLY